MIVLPIIIPVLAGVYLLIKPIKDAKNRNSYVVITSIITLITTLISNFIYYDKSIVLAKFPFNIEITLQTDAVAALFSTIFAVVWLIVSFYSFEYMKHEGEENRFFAFYLATLGALIGVSYADNFVTLYLFFEMMSLLSYVLVIHSRTNESLIAGRKYIYYSLFGASLGLIGIFYLYSSPLEKAFVSGGVMAGSVPELTLGLNIIIIIAVIGFACKGGMFPLHGWLPTAHPQAPAPASSLLSGVITKAGIIAIIRILFFTVGADLLLGSLAQNVLMILAIVTIFMGSMLAYKEKVLKKRLAYSTVSQVSYIIFGLLLLNSAGVLGALLQMVFHVLAKNVLFLCAGAIIYKTHKIHCKDLYDIARVMPKTMVMFTIAGLSLVGIPFTAGFVSKWYLAQGALEFTNNSLGIIGIIVIMLSAILTAGYLLAESAKAFFAKNTPEKIIKNDASKIMLIPIGILTLGIVVFGVAPNLVINVITNVVNTFGL